MSVIVHIMPCRRRHTNAPCKAAFRRGKLYASPRHRPTRGNVVRVSSLSAVLFQVCVHAVAVAELFKLLRFKDIQQRFHHFSLRPCSRGRQVCDDCGQHTNAPCEAAFRRGKLIAGKPHKGQRGASQPRRAEPISPRSAEAMLLFPHRKGSNTECPSHRSSGKQRSCG